MAAGREILAAAAGFALAGAALGAVAGRWALALNPTIRTRADALAFVLLAALAYAVLFVPFGIAAGLLRARRLRRTALAVARGSIALHVLAAAAAFGAFLAGVWTVSSRTWRGEAHPTAAGLGLLLALALLLAFGLVSASPALARLGERIRWLPAVLGGLAIACFASAWTAREAGQPVPAVVFPPPSLGTSPELIDPGRRKLLLFAVDGMDRDRLKSLFAQGRLPHLKAAAGRGILSPLATMKPTWSPILWNTVSTGLGAERHGILDFTEIALPGLEHGVQRLRRAPLLPPHTGLVPLVQALVWSGLLEEQTISGLHRRVPAVWNVLSAEGRDVAVVRWYASWPSEENIGWVVSDNDPRGHAARARDIGEHDVERSGITYPSNLISDLSRIGEPDLYALDRDVTSSTMLSIPVLRDLDYDERAKLAGVHEAEAGAPPQEGAKSDLLRLAYNVYQQDRFVAESALYILEHRDPEFLALYVNLIDNLSHCLHERIGVVDRSYEFVDQTLGRLLAAAGEDTDLVLLSDHGWSYERASFGHEHAPDGVLLLSGPSFAPGAGLAPKPTLFDVAPTLLALCALPASEEMPGRVLLEALDPEARSRAPAERVVTLGAYVPPALPRAPGTSTSEVRKEDVNRLRELGYVE